MSPSILAAALKLAARGIRVFPCKQDKTPYTEHGFKDASCGDGVIAEWWTRWPGALIGVPTGIRFDVLDVDLQHEPARQWLNEHRGRLPVTRTHVTRSGGLHLLFKPNAAVKCSASLIAPNVDSRGTGGYIIWWPVCGYAVLSDALLAPWPEWLLEEFRPKPQTPLPNNVSAYRGDAWLRGLARKVATAVEGQRNSTLFWAACRAADALGNGQSDEDFVVDVLLEAARHAGLPALEASRTIHSGMRRS